jgi:hypothetical protein
MSDYIGDGVYARYDGHGIQIAVNHHENEVVYLEPSVLDNLNKFYEREVKRAQAPQAGDE